MQYNKYKLRPPYISMVDDTSRLNQTVNLLDLSEREKTARAPRSNRGSRTYQEDPVPPSPEPIETNAVTPTSEETTPPLPPVEVTETWPVLTSRDINASFKVFDGLAGGTKLKIVGDRCLAVDDSYVTSWYRYSNNQGRERLKSFLEHLLVEAKRVFNEILAQIRQSYREDSSNNSTVNELVSELRNLHRGLTTFLHKFDDMKRVYQDDSKTYADLGIIRNSFYTFEDSFYRELVLGGL